MSMPSLIIESQVKPFKFYQQGAIHQAIIFQDMVLKLFNRFEANRRDTAYEVASALANRGVYTVITAGNDNYHVWIDIRDTQPSLPLRQLASLT